MRLRTVSDMGENGMGRFFTAATTAVANRIFGF